MSRDPITTRMYTYDREILLKKGNRLSVENCVLLQPKCTSITVRSSNLVLRRVNQNIRDPSHGVFGLN